ncbi:MAG: hypothetical protein DRJ47_00345 [Thermoprotei archaeon]|nr:MAG: hypothetical protein DRJ47_00345 [Thermoprotei archaeon]
MRLAILLDTSFLLPSFGVNVGERVERCLKLLAEHRGEVWVYYSRYSVLEAVLILLREVKRGQLRLKEAYEMVEAGVAAVVYGLKAVDESPSAFREALRLYGLGHRDIFDDILYATATTSEMYFLTLDRELIDFIRKKGLASITLTPENLQEKLQLQRNRK